MARSRSPTAITIATSFCSGVSSGPATPLEERAGAIVKGDHGLPIRYRTYVKAFRKIARYAKIPDEVWMMDARADGATEAEEAGVDIGLISEGLTHTNTRTSGRHIRRHSKEIVTIAEARKQSRELGEEDGTASEPPVRIASESQGKN